MCRKGLPVFFAITGFLFEREERKVNSYTLKDLNDCFAEARANDGTFVAVKIQMQGFPMPELIINDKANFDTKQEYYNKAYNEDATLKAFSGIRIVDAKYGTSEFISELLLSNESEVE